MKIRLCAPKHKSMHKFVHPAPRSIRVAFSRRHHLQRTPGDFRGARLHRLDPSYGLLMIRRYPTPAGSAEPAFASNAHVVSVWTSLQTLASSPPIRGQSTRVGRPMQRLIFIGKVTCIGVSSFLLLSTCVIGVKLLAHACSAPCPSEQAVGETWPRKQVAHSSRQMNFTAPRKLNNDMHSCLRRAQLSRSAERFVHTTLQMWCTWPSLFGPEVSVASIVTSACAEMHAAFRANVMSRAVGKLFQAQKVH